MTNSPLTWQYQSREPHLLCDMLLECQAGYTEKFLDRSKGFTIEGDSNCKWCPDDGSVDCGLHRQSPIDLKRDRAILDNPNYKDCIDWHFMRYEDDTCDWSDMLDQFKVERNALELHIPATSNGDIDCVDDKGNRQFPRLDYSKGFPDWWWLDHTSVTVPSSHVQEGKQYDGEVVLAHFYEIEHPKNQVCWKHVRPRKATWHQKIEHSHFRMGIAGVRFNLFGCLS